MVGSLLVVGLVEKLSVAVHLAAATEIGLALGLAYAADKRA